MHANSHTVFSPLALLAALGVLSAAVGDAAAAVDTSQWKCESCPFEKNGIGGTVEVGAGAVSGASPRFGDYTGLDDDGGFAIVGGVVQYRGEGGVYGRVQASDVGLDTRSLGAEVGREGVYRLRLGYAETPHRIADDIGTRRKRFDGSLSMPAGDSWVGRITLRRDVRDGSQPSAGSFFSSAAQLVAPVDHETDQLEIGASYAGTGVQASVAYQVSRFRNGASSLTWTNPFVPLVAGATRGQLALAPDNQFHQIVASAAYQWSPQIRASGELAVGRMTQDQPYLEPTLNAGLAPALAALLPALPAQSLDGQVDTLNAALRIAATPSDRLRLNASWTRDVRDNRTASAAYPLVSTDMFVAAALRSNQPFGFTNDRFRLDADHRGPGSLRTSGGIQLDYRSPTLQEVADTRETLLWARATGRPRSDLSVAVELGHAERRHDGYGRAEWIDPPQNPLLRKFNLADRSRDRVGLRADLTLGETVSIGANLEFADDDYRRSELGLRSARSVDVGADLSWALADATRLNVYAQAERQRSVQAGSQAFATADWTARVRDTANLVGAGVRHAAMGGKLELGADLVASRTHSALDVDSGAGAPAFPAMKTSRDSLMLHASYRLNAGLTLTGTLWSEHYDARDWHLDGVLPGTVPNLLALGLQPPDDRVNVLRIALRYRF